MSSNLKVNSLVPATGTEIGIGTTGGSIDFRCPATFGGNVTIGGTLTYDEVINIDSIGVITARSNIDCNGSLDVDGHTDLDNVSIAGVTTFTGAIDANGDLDVDGHTELDNVRISGIASVHNTLRFTHTGGGHIDHGAVNHNLNFRVSKSSTADTNMMQINAASENTKFRKYVTVGLQGGDDTAVLGGGSGVGAYLQLNYANNSIVNTKLLGNGNSWLNSHYGNLGIGTQTPDQTLEVFRASGTNLVKVTSQANSTVGLEIEKTGSTTQSWRIADGQTVNGALEFYDVTDSRRAMGIDGSGRVIIGPGNHAGGSQLVIKGGGTNTYSTLGMFSNHTNPAHDTLLSQIRFGSNATAVGADIRVYSVTDWASNDYPTRMSFYTTPDNSNSRQERLTIKSDGNVSIIDGNLQLASGHGIDFSATSAGVGTMTSELLDDYEEGIFTPTMKFGGGNTGMSLTSMAGIYTKIGRMVYVTVRYYMAGKGSSTGQLTLEGLPFAVGDVLGTTAVQGGWDLGWSSGMASGIHEIKAYPWEATSYLKFAKRTNSNSSPEALTDNDIVSAFDGRISFFYTT